MIRRILYTIILFIAFVLQTFANEGYIANLSDSSKISLLTITPSDEQIYTLFGHSAIRVQDEHQGLDEVFNYGLFNFGAPNFIYRFIKGETDYKVGQIPFKYFMFEYELRGVGVVEQVMNLTPADKQKIWEALITNAKPENATYRYNFLYDNCATRLRDIVEDNIDEKIIYQPTDKEQTYRNLIHECTIYSPWSRFGIDLIIGSGADKIITDRQKEFLPYYLYNSFRHAAISEVIDGTDAFVPYTSIILEPIEPTAIMLNNIRNGYSSDYPLPADSPLVTGYILFIIALLVSFFSYKKNKIILGKIFDTLLFLVAGFGGLIIFFLMFISEHPCVDANWNLVWLNPLQLIAACLFFVKPAQKCIYYYHFINFVALSLFLLAWCLIPQYLETVFIPYILALVVRSGINILQQNKNKKALKASGY
jgi:hypothetical protein